jgi:hypothetical protein
MYGLSLYNGARRIFLLVFLLGFSQSVSAQVNFFASGGYQANYSGLDRLNFVIGRFNETRSTIVDPMEEIHSLSGLSATAGIGGSNIALLVQYKRYDNNVKGTWLDNGDRQTTALKLEANDYGVAFGAVPGIGNRITFGMGLEINFLDASISSKSSNERHFQQINRYVILGFSPYAQLFVGIADHIYLYLKPSYTLDARFSDFYDVNKAINPATAQMDSDISHEGKFNRLGIYLGIVFSIGGDVIGDE